MSRTYSTSHDGAAVAKGSFPATTYADPDPILVMTSDLYERQEFDGDPSAAASFVQRILKSGDLIRTSARDALYDAATAASLTPSSVGVAGGTKVTVKGTNLRGVTAATVGGTAATSVTVVDQNTVTFVTPAKTAGAYTVVLTDDSGTVTAASQLTFA